MKHNKTVIKNRKIILFEKQTTLVHHLQETIEPLIIANIRNRFTNFAG